MAARKVITFKSGIRMQLIMNAIMTELGIDRTSVIKLSVYCFAAHLLQHRSQLFSLQQLVQELEKQALDEALPPFGVFSEE
ncbi:MAG: hypothetical protein Q4F35_05240 [Akkermansia sp.]|nr:hypothetical protein [Akkermansia sp.]